MTPKRIQLRRSKGWRLPEGAVKVDRSTRWGNPFTVDAACEAGYTDPQETAVRAFRDWLAGIPWACGCMDPMEDRRQAILLGLHLLRGRDLACWCKPGAPCHADVLLELANREE